MILVASTSHGAITETSCKAKECKTTAAWSWDLAAAAETGDQCEDVGVDDEWRIQPKSGAGATPKTLTLDLWHTTTCHNQVQGGKFERDFNPISAPITRTAGTFKAGDKKAGLFALAHGNLPGHADVYRWEIEVPGTGPPGTIKLTADHISQSPLPRWTYQPDGNVNINVKATYPNDADHEVVENAGGHGKKKGGPCPRAKQATRSVRRTFTSPPRSTRRRRRRSPSSRANRAASCSAIWGT